MTEEKLFEFNKMCLKFLGLDNIQHLEGNRYLFARMVYTVGDPDPKSFLIDLTCNPKNLGHIEFYNDWNWIHKVVRKIDNEVVESEANGIVDSIVPYLQKRNTIIVEVMKSNLKETIEAIYDYLKWYYERPTQRNANASA